MPRIFSAPNTMMVDQMRDVLARQGIDSNVRSRDLAGLSGALPPGECWTELWVDDADAPDAHALIEAALASGDAAAAPHRCARCGAPLDAGFETCWRCGASGEAPPPADFKREHIGRASPRARQRAMFWIVWIGLALVGLVMFRAYARQHFAF